MPPNIMDNYVGKRLDGRYEIQEIIGVGGMAVVYKAYDNIDDRIVAVKILKEEFLSNEEFRRRFKNESKAIAVLSHPNIVKVYDVSFGDRLQYIVMEYVEGITLKEYIEQQKIVSWSQAVHFQTQILRALQHAHDKGIVHRDVKPQNIMLLSNGTIKVTDFGIARFSRSETRTMTEGAIGSVHYISPEQARGDLTDNKADLYSAGVVLYEMLTGQLPFESENTVSVALMQLQKEPKKPREINPTIPIGLEQITMHAMQKNPADRYQTAAEMLLDLEEFKRNPAAEFDYTYFVDKEPTKFVDKGVASRTSDETAQNGDMEEQMQEEYEGKSKTLPILIGIIVALVILGGILIAVVATSGIGKSSKITVPDLVGKMYETQIKDNKEYSDFEIKVEYTASTSFEEGKVLKQKPSAGTKVNAGDEITVYVVRNSEVMAVPNVVGQKYDMAKKDLEFQGFTVDVKAEESQDVPKDEIIRTEPAAGERALNNKIILYYSKGFDLTIPDVIDFTEESARQTLEAAGFTVGDSRSQDSEEAKGTVLGISGHNVGDSIPNDEEIHLIVSSGNVPKSTATIRFNLPKSSGGNVSGILKVFVDGIVLDSVSNRDVLLDGREYTLTLTDSNVVKNVVVYVDSYIIFECTVDFNQSPAMISNSKAYQYGGNTDDPTPDKAFLPNVTGETLSTAQDKLTSAGFTNITVTYEATFDSDKADTVKSQNPEYSFLSRYETTQEISLVVYKYYNPYSNN